jgi:hypothetical protein
VSPARSWDLTGQEKSPEAGDCVHRRLPVRVFSGGVLKVVIPGNVSAVVADAESAGVRPGPVKPGRHAVMITNTMLMTRDKPDHSWKVRQAHFLNWSPAGILTGYGGVPAVSPLPIARGGWMVPGGWTAGAWW